MKLWTFLTLLCVNVRAKDWDMGCECGERSRTKEDVKAEDECKMSAVMESTDQESFDFQS